MTPRKPPRTSSPPTTIMTGVLRQWSREKNYVCGTFSWVSKDTVWKVGEFFDVDFIGEMEEDKSLDRWIVRSNLWTIHLPKREEVK